MDKRYIGKKRKARVTLTIDADFWDRCLILKEQAGINWSEIAEVSFRNVVDVIDGLVVARSKAEIPSAVEREQLLFLQRTVLKALSDANEVINQPVPKKSETLTVTD